MNKFDTNPRELKDLLINIHSGHLTLPDFQRNFVWDPSATEELIESIMKSYPAGSLLFLKGNGIGFDVREFEGAPELATNHSTTYLVLDGQQRLTSLYQAFYGTGDHRFFIDLRKLMDDADIEAAIWHESVKKAKRQKLDDIGIQADRLICPLEVVLGRKGGFHSWIHQIIDIGTMKLEDQKVLRDRLFALGEKWIDPILSYKFPVITLDQNTPMDAVCTMFETLNRRGVKLGVFELLMARSFSENVSLRKLWDQARSEHSILEQFEIDPIYVLQAICLLKKQQLKRSEVLNMQPKEIHALWPIAVDSMAESLKFLRSNLGILAPALMPHYTMIPPLAAIWSHTSQLKGPAIGYAKTKIKRWFWGSIFGQSYEKGGGAQGVQDYKEVVNWIINDGAEAKILRRLAFSPSHFREVGPRQRALYRGTLALVTSSDATDFYNGEKLTFEYMQEKKVEDHHIFPQNFMKKKADQDDIECVLNRTLIDRLTNNRISDKAPSAYTKIIENEVGKIALDRIFTSHQIPIIPLMSDDFESFLNERSKILFDVLEQRLDMKIPSAVSIDLDEEDAEDSDDTESKDPRARLEAYEISPEPVNFLNAVDPAIRNLYKSLLSEIVKLSPDMWWKLSKTRVCFYAPNRQFMVLKIGQNGLGIRVFRGQSDIPGVQPIQQKDNGGALWGRIRVKSTSEIMTAVDAIQASLKEINAYLERGDSTGWWALSN